MNPLAFCFPPATVDERCCESPRDSPELAITAALRPFCRNPYWKLARIGRLEARLYSCYSTDENPATFCTVVDLNRPPNAPPPPTDHRLVRALVRDTTGVHAFSHLAQYEMRLERSFSRAYRQLRRLQASASSA